MSQPFREDFTDKFGAAAKPDSQKTYPEQAADWTKGTADSVASTFQPQGEKTTTQKVGDAFSGDQNRNVGERGFVEKAKDTMGFNSSSSGNRFGESNESSWTGSNDNRGMVDKAKDTMGFNKDTSTGYQQQGSNWKDSTGFDDATNTRF